MGTKFVDWIKSLFCKKEEQTVPLNPNVAVNKSTESEAPKV